MDPVYDQLEHRLKAQLKEAEKLKKALSDRMASEQHLMHAYHMTIARLRDINMRDTRKGESNPKEVAKTISSLPPDTRRALVFKAPGDGMAKSVMRSLASVGLSREETLLAALLCIQEDCEQCFGFLGEANLPAEDEELVVLAAIMHYPVLSFEDFKTQEVLYQTANVEDPREMAEIKRRFEQVRGKKTMHVRKHILNYLPKDVREQPVFLKVLLEAAMERDVYGSLEMMRESASQENLKANSANILKGLSVPDKLDLLEIAAKNGFGLASNYLDLFEIPDEPEWAPRLRGILGKDVTAGHSLFGAFALEGVHHYPFGLERFEVTLPRRITNADALEYLRRNEVEGDKPRTYTSFEIGEVVTTLQDKDVRRFLENMKYNVSHGWKSLVQDNKREVVFGDYDLKVRDVLFLMVYSLFEEEEKFENIVAMIQKSHPHINDDLPKVCVYANRYYFLDLLGLNMGFMFNRFRKPNGSFSSLIEEVSEYQIHTFIHVSMEIFIRVGSAIFKDVSFAWNMLIGQCEGKIDAVFHEVGGMLDTLDTLLTIADPAMDNLTAYVPTLIDALSQDSPSLPPEDTAAEPKQVQLKVATRATIARIRDCINRYSLDAIYLRVRKTGASSIGIVQTLKMPRSKTDKLMTLLQNDPLKAQRGQAASLV
jgi:hypothetical protein